MVYLHKFSTLMQAVESIFAVSEDVVTFVITLCVVLSSDLFEQFAVLVY